MAIAVVPVATLDPSRMVEMLRVCVVTPFPKVNWLSPALSIKMKVSASVADNFIRVTPVVARVRRR